MFKLPIPPQNQTWTSKKTLLQRIRVICTVENGLKTIQNPSLLIGGL